MDGGVAVEQQPSGPQPGFFHMPKIELPKYQRAASHIPFHVHKYPLSTATGAVITSQPSAQPPVIPDARTLQPAPGEASSADPTNSLFDGKRMRKAVIRKTVDYNSAVVRYIENRVWQRDGRDHRAIQPDTLYELYMNPPNNMLEKPMNCLTTKFMRQSTNKFRCPIFTLAWTPEGRRLVTGASSGEFTLWNGLTFNFETILQAHESSVRAMKWSHNDQWMITADHAGFIKYWQSNMNNVKMYQGHKEPIRSLSFCPTDSKFASSSDDGTVRIWDFMRCHEEKILRGHGADVKCVDWHPTKSLVASGSKDNQVPIKLWDPKTGSSLATLHAHKFTVMDLKWSKNGLWLLTASRDHLVKLFDIRNMKEEVQVFKGHKKEATAVAWHPINETLFCSGGSDGSIMFWNAGTEKELGSMEEAHDAIIWDLAWHPLGHILSSASNDHSTKFWTRNRPGDSLRDKYNLNTLPIGPDGEVIEEDQLAPSASSSLLPGMGLEHGLPPVEEEKPKSKPEDELPTIPGLDWGSDMQYLKEQALKDMPQRKKMPFARPIPKCFEQAWISNQQPGLLVKEEDEEEGDRKSKRRDRKVPRSKIKSLLSLDLPERPPPGLRDMDFTEFDESERPPRGQPSSEPPHSVGQMPPGLGIQPPKQDIQENRNTDIGDRPGPDFGNRPRPEFGDRPGQEFSSRPGPSFGDRPGPEFGSRTRQEYEDRARPEYGDLSRREYGEDIDFRFARDIVPEGMDQDYRADQDYRGDQDLRSDKDFRSDRDFREKNEPMRNQFRGPNDRGQSEPMRDQFRGQNDRGQNQSLREQFRSHTDNLHAVNEPMRDSYHGSNEPLRDDYRNMNDPFKDSFDKPRGRGRGGPMSNRGERHGPADDRHDSLGGRGFEDMEHDDYNIPEDYERYNNEFNYNSQNKMQDDSDIEPHEMMDYSNKHSPSPGPRSRGRGRNDNFRGNGNESFRGGKGGTDNFRGGRDRGRGESFRGGHTSRGGGDSFRGGNVSGGGGDSFRGGNTSSGNASGGGGDSFRGGNTSRGRGDSFRGGNTSRGRGDSFRGGRIRSEFSASGSDSFRGGTGEEGEGGSNSMGNRGRGGFRGGGRGGNDQDRGMKRNRDDSSERDSWGGDMGNEGFGDNGPGDQRSNVHPMAGMGDKGGRGGRGRGDQGDGGRGSFQGRGGRGRGFRGGDRGGWDNRGRGRGGQRGGARGRGRGNWN